MCICDHLSPDPNTNSSDTSGKVSPASDQSRKRRRAGVNAGMPPPPSKRSATRTTAVCTTMLQDTSHQHRQSSPSSSTCPLSLGDLSVILDPFFDTCLSPRSQEQEQELRRTEACFLSDIAPNDDNSSLITAEASSAASTAAFETTASGVLREFLEPDNSGWMGMIDDMETEKKNMLKPDEKV